MRRSKKVMENYVCPNCWNQIDKCTCECYPPWNLIMVDTNMQEIVRELNNKRYITRSCCESHYNRNFNLYVSFEINYHTGCPEGFTFLKDDNAIVYSFKKNERADKKEYEKIKKEKLEILTEWAKSLPARNRG